MYKQKTSLNIKFGEVFCDPSEIQTRNRRLRRALLYSVELRGQIKKRQLSEVIQNHIEIEVTPNISSLKFRMEISTGKNPYKKI